MCKLKKDDNNFSPSVKTILIKDKEYEVIKVSIQNTADSWFTLIHVRQTSDDNNGYPLIRTYFAERIEV